MKKALWVPISEIASEIKLPLSGWVAGGHLAAPASTFGNWVFCCGVQVEGSPRLRSGISHADVRADQPIVHRCNTAIIN